MTATLKEADACALAPAELDELVSALREMIETNRLGAKNASGAFNRLFEQAFAERLGVGHAVTLNSGTAALHAALVGVGVGPGDHVIVDPLLKFGAVAALRIGAVPVFADIDPDSFLMSPTSVRARLTDRTRAVVATALFGLPVPVAAYRAALAGTEAAIIEDCAQALFTGTPEGMAGTRGDAAIFSFQASKHLSTGEGGMLVTDDAAIAERAIELKDHGWAPGRESWEGPAGWMYRMPEPCAAIGYYGLREIDAVLERHRAIGALLNDVARDSGWLRPQQVPPGDDHSYWTWAAAAEDDDRFGRLKQTFEGEGRPFEFGYCAHGPIYLRPLFQRYKPLADPMAARYKPGLCPHAERVSSQLLHLKVDATLPGRYFYEQALALQAALQSMR